MKKLAILLIDFNFKTTMIRIFDSFFLGGGWWWYLFHLFNKFVLRTYQLPDFSFVY